MFATLSKTLMKLISLLLITIFIQVANAQKTIDVCAQKQLVTVNLQDEDVSRILTLTSTSLNAKDVLFVVNNNWKAEKEWKRTFSIYDDKDRAIADVVPCKSNGKYQLLLKDLFAKANKGETYTLYTMAIPRDPKKAALVRVRRVLVCRISIT